MKAAITAICRQFEAENAWVTQGEAGQLWQEFKHEHVATLPEANQLLGEFKRDERRQPKVAPFKPARFGDGDVLVRQRAHAVGFNAAQLSKLEDTHQKFAEQLGANFADFSDFLDEHNSAEETLIAGHNPDAEAGGLDLFVQKLAALQDGSLDQAQVDSLNELRGDLEKAARTQKETEAEAYEKWQTEQVGLELNDRSAVELAKLMGQPADGLDISGKPQDKVARARKGLYYLGMGCEVEANYNKDTGELESFTVIPCDYNDGQRVPLFTGIRILMQRELVVRPTAQRCVRILAEQKGTTAISVDPVKGSYTTQGYERMNDPVLRAARAEVLNMHKDLVRFKKNPQTGEIMEVIPDMSDKEAKKQNTIAERTAKHKATAEKRARKLDPDNTENTENPGNRNIVRRVIGRVFGGGNH